MIVCQALHNFLRKSEKLEYDSCCFQIMDSFDLDTITKGRDSKNLIPADFTSPFLGWTIDQVKEWFIANLKAKPREDFVNGNFVVIDEHVQEAKVEAEDEDEDSEEDFTSSTVLLCDAQTRLFKKVRIRFPMVMSMAINLHMKETMRSGPLGAFWRSGTTCTPEAYQMLIRNGLYFHKGVPEIDEGWRKFAQEWWEGGPHDYDSDDYFDDDFEDEKEEGHQDKEAPSK